MVNLSNPTDGGYDEMVRLFGGDALATRAANALKYSGIPSMKALDGLLTALGEGGLRERLREVRNLGERALERISQGLTEYRKSNPGPQAGPKELAAVLPEGFARRAYFTALHFRDREEGPFPEVVGSGESMGLTREDLLALARLFSYEVITKND